MGELSVIPIADARRILRAALSSYGLTAAEVEEVATHLIVAEAIGKRSHGLFRIGGIVDYLGRTRLVRSETTWVSPSRLHLASQKNLGYLDAARLADEAIMRLDAGESAVYATASGTSHCGRLGHYTERLADKGYCSFAVTHSHPWLRPIGASRSVLGSSAVAVAIPGPSGTISVDVSPNAISVGEVRLAHFLGSAIPPGVAVDAEGLPTTVPGEVLQGGGILPTGDHKGYALALAIVLLCTLAGGDALPSDSRGYGTVVAAARLEAVGVGEFGQRVEELLGLLVASGMDHIPGSARNSVDFEGGHIRVHPEVLALAQSLAS